MCRSSAIRSRMAQMLSGGMLARDCLWWVSFSTASCPATNFLCHSYTYAFERVSSPNYAWNLLKISASLVLSFHEKLNDCVLCNGLVCLLLAHGILMRAVTSHCLRLSDSSSRHPHQHPVIAMPICFHYQSC